VPEKQKQPSQPKVLLIIPCYNEGENIGALLDEIRGMQRGYGTLVVDDGSDDNTFEVASRLSFCVQHIENLGIGGSVHTGIKYAQEHGYDFCVQVDGDGQHPPDQVAKLLHAYEECPANIVIGSRYLQEDTFRSTWARRLGSRIIGGFLKKQFGQSITDATSGLRLMDRTAISFFAEDYPHDYPEPISLARAFHHGLTAREAPVEMRSREHGASSISGIKTFLYMIRVLGYLVLVRFE